MATKHAVLSASSSERWLNCPPSARLCETYEDKSSDYAAEGTDAHALAEARLKQALGIPTEDPVENLTWYNAEMEDCAQGYAITASLGTPIAMRSTSISAMPTHPLWKAPLRVSTQMTG